LGIDYPTFGFAHDIAAVAAITNAGVYEATRSFPDEISEELALIRSLFSEKPFGVDLVFRQGCRNVTLGKQSKPRYQMNIKAS
jgi:hypothetical protein